jgi:hypothetical protein
VISAGLAYGEGEYSPIRADFRWPHNFFIIGLRLHSLAGSDAVSSIQVDEIYAIDVNSQAAVILNAQ